MTATCPECGRDGRVAKAGALYRHGDCPGGGQPPTAIVPRGTNVPAVSGRAEPLTSTDAAEVSSTPGQVSLVGQTAVYLVRLGRRNPELRYSLRSLANA